MYIYIYIIRIVTISLFIAMHFNARNHLSTQWAAVTT